MVFFVDKAESAEDDVIRIRQSVDQNNYPDVVYRVLAMISWAYKHCGHSRFVALTTDKTFINTRRVEMLANKEMFTANRYFLSCLLSLTLLISN